MPPFSWRAGFRIFLKFNKKIFTSDLKSASKEKMRRCAFVSNGRMSLNLQTYEKDDISTNDDGGGILSTQAATYIGSGTVDFSKAENWEGNAIPDGFPTEADAGENRTYSGYINFSQTNIEWTINGKFQISGGGNYENKVGLWFNSENEGANPATIKLNLGETGMLSVDKVLNFSQGAAGSKDALVISANLVGGIVGEATTRTLIETGDSMWNYEAISKHSLADTFSFSGFTVHETLLTSVPADLSSLEDGVAYIVIDIKENGEEKSAKTISVVYKAGTASVPEPTTATLGLLGVAGLLLRRRRI